MKVMPGKSVLAAILPILFAGLRFAQPTQQATNNNHEALSSADQSFASH